MFVTYEKEAHNRASATDTVNLVSLPLSFSFSISLQYSRQRSDYPSLCPIQRFLTNRAAATGRPRIGGRIRSNIREYRSVSRLSHAATKTEEDERNDAMGRKPCGRGKRLEQLLFNCA